MKAIDFACHFLTRLAHDKLTPTAKHVLVCVAAGLETSPDIAHFTGMTPNVCSAALRGLERKKLVRRALRGHCVFLLTTNGKQRVASLFGFFPPSPSYEEEKTPDD